MNTFGITSGILIMILGIAVMDYGLDPNVPNAYHAFYLGLAGIVIGGVIIWASSKGQKNPLLVKSYQVEGTKSISVTDSIKYRNLYENSPVPQRTVNTDGIILACNEKYAKTFGYEKNEIIGKSLFEHAAEQSQKDMRDSFDTWKRAGHVENKEIWFKRKDGTTFPGIISANNIYDDSGKLIGSNSVIRDISDIYKARKVLEEHERQKIQLEELQKMNSSKEGFYMMISKECQIPLEPIKKNVQILNESSKLTKKQKEAISEIQDNTLRLEQLINDIVDVQKLYNNKMEFERQQFNVTDLINDVVNSCSPMMIAKKIEFVNDLTTNSSLNSDKKRLEQVFYNLVQNAIDFVPQDEGKIEMGARDDGTSVLFYVKDNGIGISENRKDSIFKKFYQVDVSLKRKYGGSGFGLVICKGIVENLGGKIWFESQEGNGTTFYFSIPK
ncbi:MAG: PAS domain-containing sensor histidine kinase [Nitrososphaera sp.]|jgi:PAS domain S-box-containing protein